MEPSHGPKETSDQKQPTDGASSPIAPSAASLRLEAALEQTTKVALEIARKCFGHAYVGTEHLLLALCKSPVFEEWSRAMPRPLASSSSPALNFQDIMDEVLVFLGAEIADDKAGDKEPTYPDEQQRDEILAQRRAEILAIDCNDPTLEYDPERLTNRAKIVLEIARGERKTRVSIPTGEEASPWVAIAYGLVLEGSGVAANVFRNMGVGFPEYYND